MTNCKRTVKISFGNAAATYNDAAIIQREVLERLLAKLDLFSVQAELVLDLGSGTGLARKKLQHKFGYNSYIACDLALPMLQYAINKDDNHSIVSICGDAEALPFQEDSFDVVFSASTLQWCNDIPNVFNHCLRILRVDGLFLFSLFGPNTLKELRHSFAQVDPYPRVKHFADMHLLGDELVRAGFHAPVLESEHLTVEYTDPMQLLHDLKTTGTTNNLEQRSRGLLTRRKIEAALHAYQQFRLENGKFPATYEIIYGHAWKSSTSNRTAIDPDQWQPIQFK